jgi:outer membrane protein OmpA-like peptidoglycan-associated protein
MAYAKSDFVPGDEIIFEDNQANEQMGEFPSQWDLTRGNAEIASIGGEKCIYLIDAGTTIIPLMKEIKKYFPDKFPVEFDYFTRDKAHEKGMNQYLEIGFNSEKGANLFKARWYPCESRDYLWTNWKTPDGESRDASNNEIKVKGEEWHHVAISFNQRALKVYFDGIRKANIPNVAKPDNLYIWMSHSGGVNMFYIKNFRIAKGAVPFYDRLTTDGKIITYGITFDVGKSTIKPESMGEINRIATLIKENPDLKFSVEGHTDNTGSAATNQTFSDARSAAVVAKLVEMGVAKDRLTSAGKGQNSPIADNSTDEGRAKNRRVEFVKL